MRSSAYSIDTRDPVTDVHQLVPPTNKIVQPCSATVTDFEKTSVKTHCKICNTEVNTRVNEKTSQKGICWAITCCFFGSWLLSLLVLCMDAFKVYRHCCPSCNAVIGEYHPEMSGKMICLLVFLSLLAIGLEIMVITIYLIPLMNRNNY